MVAHNDIRSLFNCVLTTLKDIFNEDLKEDLVNNPKGKADLENLSLAVKTLQGKQGRHSSGAVPWSSFDSVSRQGSINTLEAPRLIHNILAKIRSFPE